MFVTERGSRTVRKISIIGSIISICAGNGVNSLTGNGGPATSAAMGMPAQIFVSSSNVMYIADSTNHVVRAVNLNTNIISTFAGSGMTGSGGDGGLASSASFSSIQGVWVDPGGAVYVSDWTTHTVRKIATFMGGSFICWWAPATRQETLEMVLLRPVPF
jgi:hypothetical protein